MQFIIPKTLHRKIQNKYDVNNNTFISKRKDYEVEIGDIKQEGFYPQLKLKRWENEVNFSLRLLDTEVDTAIIETNEDKIIYRKNKYFASFYELEPDTQNENGKYEFDITLLEKPRTNVLQFSIQSKELEFFYQPPLTAEDLKKGSKRPENVVGSYAVYHKTKSNNHYQTGKAFHIYRPEITDAEGKIVWGELNIEGDILSLTIPQEFLDTASYPVVVDPTFGYTSTGGSTERLDDWDSFYLYRWGNDYTGVNGTLDSLHIYAAGTSYSAGVYLNDKDSVSSNNHGEVFSNTFNPDSEFPRWYTINAGDESLSSAKTYIISASGWSGSSGLYIDVYYDSGSVNEYYTNGTTTPGAGSTWNVTPSSGSKKFSYYAMYTASAVVIPNKALQLRQAVKRGSYY